jgi:hypothetical protein
MVNWSTTAAVDATVDAKVLSSIAVCRQQITVARSLSDHSTDPFSSQIHPSIHPLTLPLATILFLARWLNNGSNAYIGE